MWWDILKNAKLSAKGKGKTLDTSDFKINIEDDKCNKQLKEWADKIKQMSKSPILSEAYTYNKWFRKNFIPYRQGTIKENEYLNIAYETRNRIGYQPREYFEYPEHQIEESYQWEYNPIPEKVACKAIDMLKAKGKGSKNTEVFNGYTITVFNDYSPRFTIAHLEISSNDAADEYETEVGIGLTYTHSVDWGNNKTPIQTVEISAEILGIGKSSKWW